MKITKTDGSGDVILEFQQGGTTSYVMGLDDSDSNLFKIHSDTALADDSDITIDSDGSVKFKEYLSMTAMSAPGTTTNRLYNVSSNLTWNGSALQSHTGTALNGFTDSLNANNSIYLGGRYGNSSANYNIGIGRKALYERGSDSRDNNTAIGYEAGKSLTTGDDNVFVGYQAGDTTTDVDKTVIIGSGAGGANMTSAADGTIAIGYTSGEALTSGAANTFIGYQSGKANTTGQHNTAVGYDALTANIDGHYNTAIGAYALKTQTSDDYNTAVGYEAGKVLNGGDKNTLIGTSAGESITTGDNNVCIGYNSGKDLATGSNCIYIGYESTASASDVSNEIVIGKGLTGKGANRTFIGGTSGIYNAQNNANWTTTSSDIRLKRNIVDIDIGINELTKLRIVKFRYKEDKDTPKKFSFNSEKYQYGIIAQEARKILPSMINEDDEGWLSSTLDSFIWCFARSVQQLYSIHKSQIENIKNDELYLLQKKQNELENKINNILN